jgi:integrase/recombinase XerD
VLEKELLQRPSSKILDNGEEEESDPNFDLKLDAVTAGGPQYLKEHLLTKITRKNCKVIVDYVLAMQIEIGPSQTYRIDTINKLKFFAEFHNLKAFTDLTRQDVIDFLDRFRKPETADSMHKWVSTYESYRIVLLRFFKWLHQPNISHINRSKPAVVDNIPQIKRKEISPYKPTDLWTEEDDYIFYKYCPSSRDRCWHAVARDTGCRPHELLKLKIKDVIFQQIDGGSGYQVARITVNGKTGTRNVRLCNSLPRLKDWLTNGHPFAGNPNAPLFCGVSRKNTGRRLTMHSINAMYERYKKQYFGTRLLEDPTVPEEDKRKIRDLLQKKWNPYVRRHTTATEVSKVLKDPVLIDQYMGWSHSGNTRRKYQHYYTDDAFEAMLVNMDGLPLPDKRQKDKMKALLKPKMCPNCDESNKPENKFCSKCKFVLSFDAFNEAIEEKAKTAKEAEKAKQELTEMRVDMEQVKTKLANTTDQTATMLEIFTKICRNQVTIAEPEVKIFLEQKLGAMTNGEWGEDPESGIVSKPI